MFPAILFVVAVGFGLASLYFWARSPPGVATLLVAISATCLGVSLTLFSESTLEFANVLPWAVLVLGLVCLLVAVFFCLARPCVPRGLRMLGVVKAWPSRDNFQQDGMGYADYCRSLIQSASPGATIRLLSTAGDGIAVVFGGIDTAFEIPLRNGCKFRIVLVNPLSDQVSVKQDAEDLTGDYGPPREEGYLREKIRRKLELLEDWRDQAVKDPQIEALEDSIDLKCVDSIPVVNLIDNASRALFALQTINRKGKDSPIFLVDKNGLLYDYLQTYFDFLFRNMSIDGDAALRGFNRTE